MMDEFLIGSFQGSKINSPRKVQGIGSGIARQITLTVFEARAQAKS